MTSTAAKTTTVIVLLAEDDPGDQLLTKEAFASLPVPHDLRIVPDGVEALDYLYKRGEYAVVAPRPDLILLDLNMPRVNGQKVAEQVRLDPTLRDIPIVVLTTSQRHEDMLRAYGRGVTFFITKPLDFADFIAVVRDLERLIKYVRALKTVRQRGRLTDRQIFRLLRRQHEMEELASAMFQQQMGQIEQNLTSPDEPSGEVADHTIRRERMARVAQKILDGLPERGTPTARTTHSTADSDSDPGTPGLRELARALEAARSQPQNRARSAPHGERKGDQPA
jgi:two-component system response regulator